MQRESSECGFHLSIVFAVGFNCHVFAALCDETLGVDPLQRRLWFQRWRFHNNERIYSPQLC